MLKEYLFKITKEQYIKEISTNKEEAYELAEDDSFCSNMNEQVVDIELIDVITKDEDIDYDNYKLRKKEESYYE